MPKISKAQSDRAFNSCIYELKTVTVRLKSLTRSLLQRLRPVALGRVTLAELVSELVSSFQSRIRMCASGSVSRRALEFW